MIRNSQTIKAHSVRLLVLAMALCLSATAVRAQAPKPGGRTINAIGYQVNGGSTEVDLKTSGLIPTAEGEAKIEAKPAVTMVEAKVEGLTVPTKLGAEFLTYVLWAVSPEGRALNLGELLLDNDGKAEIKTTTQLQSFSLFVSAEPYAVVRQPSEMLILENAVRKNTKGRIIPVNNYQLMNRAQYQKLGNPLSLSLDLKNVPLEMYEARNAVEIARARGAEKYAGDVFAKAEGGLKMAEAALTRKANKKDIVSLARQAAQSSEDARALTVERQEQERIANERAAAAAAAKAAAEAKAATEAAEVKRRADEEARRQAELAAAKEAQVRAEAAANEARLRAEAAEAKRKADDEARRLADAAAKAKRRADEEARRQTEAAAEAKRKSEEEARRQTEIAAANEARIKAEAAAAEAKAKAEADVLRAKEEAAKAEADRARRATEELRAQLLEQFNRILETRDTARGLVITMADVLFDTGKFDLRPPLREQLAKLSGILLAHPTLHLEVEGHTDSVGGDELNQRLSEQRASTVREYLVKQGLASGSVSSKGFGKTSPIAENDTAAGRQKNRRVELIVSGDVIGVSIR